ncbi:hypothetical protein RND81_08G031400 [Saponaria officinalis]|uniref:Uncharacterized protein n=1 Tax=Saponaria officinalis TaxID=3572 RepID=A0AAW1J3N1_SAPOF
MNWLERKIFLYNVTIGLYMLDWWERYLVNTLLIIILCYLIKLLKTFSLQLVVLTIGVFCKSSLGFILPWLCSYSTINDTASVGSGT